MLVLLLFSSNSFTTPPSSTPMLTTYLGRGIVDTSHTKLMSMDSYGVSEFIDWVNKTSPLLASFLNVISVMPLEIVPSLETLAIIENRLSVTFSHFTLLIVRSGFTISVLITLLNLFIGSRIANGSITANIASGVVVCGTAHAIDTSTASPGLNTWDITTSPISAPP